MEDRAKRMMLEYYLPNEKKLEEKRKDIERKEQVSLDYLQSHRLASEDIMKQFEK